MAITIKEIQVRVTVESDACRKGVDEDMLLKMKREIMKELKETIRKETTLKNER